MEEEEEEKTILPEPPTTPRPRSEPTRPPNPPAALPPSNNNNVPTVNKTVLAGRLNESGEYEPFEYVYYEYYYDYETASSCEKGELKMQVSSMFMCDYVEPSSDCMSSITYNWDFVLYLEGRKPKASFPNS